MISIVYGRPFNWSLRRKAERKWGKVSEEVISRIFSELRRGIRVEQPRIKGIFLSKMEE